jgi:hypothetical protein
MLVYGYGTCLEASFSWMGRETWSLGWSCRYLVKYGTILVSIVGGLRLWHGCRGSFVTRAGGVGLIPI